MKSLLKKIWSLWTGNTEVRHAGTALVATVIVVSAPVLTDWANLSDQKYVTIIIVTVLAALVRWAQKALETKVAPTPITTRIEPPAAQ